MVLVNNRDKLEWAEGMTVKDLLIKMKYTYFLITVTVNGDVVPKAEYDYFVVPDNADVNVFHLAHGG